MLKSLIASLFRLTVGKFFLDFKELIAKFQPFLGLRVFGSFARCCNGFIKTSASMRLAARIYDIRDFFVGGVTVAGQITFESLKKLKRMLAGSGRLIFGGP